MKKPLREIKQDFQDFLQNMPGRIDRLKEFLGVVAFSYEPAEIELVENFYRKYIGAENDLGLSENELDKLIETYIGVAYLWHFGGEWYLIEKTSADKYGYAAIIKYGGKGYPYVAVPPLGWLRQIRNGQRDEPLRRMFERWISYFFENPEHELEPVRNIQ